MTAAIVCANCESEFDPIRHRWLCPACGWKEDCCEAEPAQVAQPTIGEMVYVKAGIEWAKCRHCDDDPKEILRLEGGMWSHLAASKDEDHLPEPDLEALTERQAEEQLEFGRVDMPTHTVVGIHDQIDVPKNRYL